MGEIYPGQIALNAAQFSVVKDCFSKTCWPLHVNLVQSFSKMCRVETYASDEELDELGKRCNLDNLLEELKEKVWIFDSGV